MSYTYTKDSKLHCVLCPHHCKLAEGERGICMVRENRYSELHLPFYGVLSAVSNDPIEKKPLYHFYPGSFTFSVGFYGCSFRCPFCQNYRIAQSTNVVDTHSTQPKKLVEQALRQGAEAIAYTYSEPLVHFEWILETAKYAHDRGLKNILVSNGFINPQPAQELLEVLDAANIDLKSFRPEFYQDIVGGKLEPVLAFIKKASQKIHLEVTTLVIPGYTDSEQEITDIARFLAELNINIPLHLSCYYPAYKFNAPPTEASTVFALTEVAKQRLNFVYPGNVGLSEVNTYCSACGNTLIRRMGYRVEMPGIKGQSCVNCGRTVPFPVK